MFSITFSDLLTLKRCYRGFKLFFVKNNDYMRRVAILPRPSRSYTVGQQMPLQPKLLQRLVFTPNTVTSPDAACRDTLQTLSLVFHLSCKREEEEEVSPAEILCTSPCVQGINDYSSQCKNVSYTCFCIQCIEHWSFRSLQHRVFSHCKSVHST